MRYNVAAVIIATAILGSVSATLTHAAVPVVWDGSAGISSHPSPPHGVRRWEEGNWTKDGVSGLTANAAIGQDGSTGGRGGVDIIIGLGHTVYHDHNDSDDVPGALGDFKPRMDLFGPGSLTIKDGATLWMDAHSDPDGRWTRVGMDINLDNGTLRRTVTPAYCSPAPAACSQSGGKVIFGYRNELLPDTTININLTNGGRIESHGKLTFGDVVETFDNNQSTGHNPGIGVHVTINDGTLDLTGGNTWDDFLGLVNGEMVFFYEWNEVTNQPKNEDYYINFTGPGSITVDTGLFVVDQASNGFYLPKGNLKPDLYTSYTYEDLWTLGILRANGESGLTGATFGDYFTTTGAPDDVWLGIDNENYTLTSLLSAAGLEGDHNNDGIVNAADYVTWRKNPASYGGDPGYGAWLENFGASGPGAGGAVPEPGSLLLALAACSGLYVCRRRRGSESFAKTLRFA